MQNIKNAFAGRTLCIACAAFTAGIALRAFSIISLSVLAVTLTAFLLAVTFKKLPNLFIIFIVCASLLAGFSHLNFTKLKIEHFSDEFSGRYLTVSGKITEVSTSSDKRQVLVIESDSFSCLGKNYKNDFSCLVYTDFDKTFSIGDNITFSDIFSPVRKNSIHTYDYELYLHTKNISTLFNLSSEKITLIDNHHTFLNEVQIFSKNTADRIRSLIGGDEGHVASAITLGDKSGFSDNLRDIFSKSGISHIVAVSGMHMSIIVVFLFLLMSKLRVNYKIRNIVTLVFVIIYMALTGFSPSVTRAGIMAIFMLVSAIVDSKYDALTALFFSAALLLIANPYLICSASFLLSYLAFLGLLVLAGPIKNRITVGFIPDFLKQILASSIAATVFTLPATVLIFGSISTYSLFTNLIILPFVSIIFGAVIIALILSLIYGPAGILFGFIAKLLIKTLLTVASGISLLPYSYINIKTPSVFDIICYAVIIFILYLMLTGRKPGLPGHCTLAVIACYFVVSITLSSLTYSVTFFDVGQGDCALIKTPGNHNFLIDTGPSGSTTMSALKSAGVNKLDAVFISHTDSDHSGALGEILENIPVVKVVFPHYNITSEEMENLKSISVKNGASVDFISRYHSYNLHGIPVDVVWPSPNQNTVSDENDSSLVLSLDLKGTNFLFTGDTGISAEELILKTNEIIDCDVLKVAHHGSDTSTSEKFLKKVSPQYSVISAGKYNSYGHPHADTLSRLENVGSTVLRTDISGDIIFSTDLFGNTYLSYGGHK